MEYYTQKALLGKSLSTPTHLLDEKIKVLWPRSSSKWQDGFESKL